MLGVGVFAADDAKASETVAERERDRRGDQRVPGPALGLGERDVPGREIDMIDAGQDQLQRAALGADHQVEAAGVPGQAVLKLGAEQEQQDDHADAERE